MDNQVQVSVITPAYNAERYILQTIESVQRQTFPYWQMIIIDDGSTDSTAHIVREITKQDSRVVLLQQSNAGSAAARNYGIRTAIGRYIALLDADDLWDECFLEKQLHFMKEKNALLVYSSYKRIDENSKECLKPFICRASITYKQMLITNHIACLTGLYDTSQFGKIYLREELKSIRDDYAYWLDIIKLVGIAYGNREILASYRVISNSTTGKKIKLIKAQFLFYYRYLKLGIFKSIFNTLYWAIAGFFKFIQ